MTFVKFIPTSNMHIMKKTNNIPLFCSALCIFLTALSCSSDDDQNTGEQSFNSEIETLTGQIQFLEEAPESVELDVLVSDTLLFIFAEKKNHILLTSVATDLSMPGDYFPDSIPDEEQTWEALIPGSIQAGTKVTSYYLHYNNETYKDNFNTIDYLGCIGQYQVNAEIKFTTPVLGIIMQAGLGELDRLGNSNRELGLPSVDYCEDNLLHFPGINIADGCQSDQFILSEDRMTLTLKNNTDIHHDNYRVVLAAVE